MNTSSSDVAVTERSTRPRPSAFSSRPSKSATMCARPTAAGTVYVVVMSSAESWRRGASALSAQFRDAEKIAPRVAFRRGHLKDEEKLFGVDPRSGFAASFSVVRRRSSSNFEAAASLASGTCCAKIALS
jgi:hypothetical protein